MTKSILHIITSLDQGGAQTILYNICRQDCNIHHQIIYLSKGSFYREKFLSLGIRPVLINFTLLNFLLSSYRLFRYIQFLKPCAVQTWLYHSDLIGGVISRLAGIKNISWGIHHSHHTFRSSKLTTLFIVSVSALFSYFIPKNIIYCAYSAKKFHENVFFSKNKSIVIPNGYDPEQYINSLTLRNEFRLKHNLDVKHLVLGCAARFHPVKDHKNLFESLSIIKNSGVNFSLLLAGDHIDHNNLTLMSLIEDYDLSEYVILLGNYSLINCFYNAIDILLLSSISEAFPNVIFESLMSGTPCVSTNVGDLHLVAPLQPYLSPPEQPQYLANNILKLLSDIRNNQATVSPSSLRHYALTNHSLDSMINMYSQVWYS